MFVIVAALVLAISQFLGTNERLEAASPAQRSLPHQREKNRKRLETALPSPVSNYRHIISHRALVP